MLAHGTYIRCSRRRMLRDVLGTGSIQDIKWRDVRVGHILKIEDEELFPADMLCLFSALEDQACFIKTTNLDGESNLKIRRPLDLRDAAPEEDADVLDLKATLECEQPNANLHKFQGRLMYTSGNEGIVLMTSLLLNAPTLAVISSGHVPQSLEGRAHLKPFNPVCPRGD